MRNVSRGAWGGFLALGLFALGMIFWVFRRHDQLPVVQRSEERLSRNEVVEVGGVRRPVTDVRRPGDRPAFKPGDSALRNALPRLPIEPGGNPQVASVIEASSTGKHPERLSSLVAPRPFDPAAYQTAPKTYLNISEPGRVWQIAQPGPGVRRLVSLVPEMQSIEQGESVLFKVQVVPGAPVTFTSFDQGAFQNQLTSITVAADQQGIARANFTGTGGTTGEVQILAGSPLTSGQAQFLVDVSFPKRSRGVSATGSVKGTTKTN